MPGIVRATALSLLARQLDDNARYEAERLLDDEDPLVRLAAVNALSGIEPQGRVRQLYRLVTGEIRAVQMGAASALAGVPLVQLDHERFEIGHTTVQIEPEHYKSRQPIRWQVSEGSHVT